MTDPMIDSSFPAYYSRLFFAKQLCLRDDRYAEICSKFLDICFESFTVAEWRKILASFFADYLLPEFLNIVTEHKSYLDAQVDFFNRFLAGELTYSALCYEIYEDIDEMILGYDADTTVLTFSKDLLSFLSGQADIVFVCENFVLYYTCAHKCFDDKAWADLFMAFFSAADNVKAHKERQAKA